MNIFIIALVSGSDYIGIVDVPLMFGIGDIRLCQNVDIINDDECETPNENFFLNLEYVGGDMPITITQRRTQVIINDTVELECGKPLVKILYQASPFVDCLLVFPCQEW